MDEMSRNLYADPQQKNKFTKALTASVYLKS